MHRAVEMLGGGILGFVAGSFLCAPLIAHVFGPTTVTWDSNACPSGIYTITSTARSVENGLTYTTTTAHIRLPHGSIAQEFSDLPAGQYVVTAVARDARGRIFNSDEQDVSGLGPSRGRQAVQTGSAAQQAGYARTIARAATVKAPVSSLSASTVTPPPAEAYAPVPVERPLFISGEMAGLVAAFPQWKTVVFIDADGDGAVDEARIELLTGEVLVVSIGSVGY